MRSCHDGQDEGFGAEEALVASPKSLRRRSFICCTTRKSTRLTSWRRLVRWRARSSRTSMAGAWNGLAPGASMPSRGRCLRGAYRTVVYSRM